MPMEMKAMAVLAAVLGICGAARGIDYKTDVLPIMKEHCWDCHSNENKVKGNLALDDLDEVRDYQIGKSYQVPLGKLSAESQALARRLAGS